jgi:NAD(P)-dependent dehydrogenase (short-subunit alcohol dehydrogenase family)
MKTKNSLQPGFSGVITGASTGVGRSLAILLATDYQAKLVINARTEDALLDTKRIVEERGGKAIAIVGDIAGKDMPARLVSTCVEEYGDIDLLVNNAGISIPGLLQNVTLDDWHRVMDVNFYAPLYGVYAALPHFLKKNQGTIVNVSSVAGKVGLPGRVCYSTSKFACLGMSEGMAAELIHRGIDVVTVCPGWIRSHFFRKNNLSSTMDPTTIGERKDFRGWMMRNLLSYSPQQAAEAIRNAMMAGNSHEIILTLPAIFTDRLMGICPPVAFAVTRKVPKQYLDNTETSELETKNSP